MNKDKKIRKGFTLAEVLITLGIIGVVAALTMPTLLASYQERVTITKLKKFNTIINQAFTMSVKDNGTPDEWGFTRSVDDAVYGQNIVIDKFVPYLKVSSVCRYGDACMSNPKYSHDAYSLDGSDFSAWYTPAIILADGSSIDDISMSSSNCQIVHGNSLILKNVCGEFFVDVNGVKPPNATGKDIFFFRITKYGVYPGGDSEETARSFEDFCNLSKPHKFNGYGCTSWVLNNENMDYLHCNNLSWKGLNKCK